MFCSHPRKPWRLGISQALLIKSLSLEKSCCHFWSKKPRGLGMGINRCSTEVCGVFHSTPPAKEWYESLLSPSIELPATNTHDPAECCLSWGGRGRGGWMMELTCTSAHGGEFDYIYIFTGAGSLPNSAVFHTALILSVMIKCGTTPVFPVSHQSGKVRL